MLCLGGHLIFIGVKEVISSPQARTERLKARALELGFHAVGVARAEPPDPKGRLKAWLEAGMHGTMAWMATSEARRLDPSASVPGARSVVAVMVSYHHPDASTGGTLKVARYAQAKDYHRWMKRRLRKLRKMLLAMDPDCIVYPTVDTSPVLERAWAARAGIAWIGKSTMAIHPGLGTYTFLGTLITDSELRYDAPIPDRCGSCTACLDLCPTGAFPKPRVLDARKCIAYWTLERPEGLPAEATDLHGWVAGCDVCQQVCPWNKFAQPNLDPNCVPRPELSNPDAQLMSRPEREPEVAKLLQGTSLQRTGARAIIRNTRRALGLSN